MKLLVIVSIQDTSDYDWDLNLSPLSHVIMTVRTVGAFFVSFHAKYFAFPPCCTPIATFH